MINNNSAYDNIIFIGKKSAMAYVLACVTQFNMNRDTVILKARGKSISHAVDVAEIVRNKFVTDTEVKGIKIATEIIESENGEKMNVSSIEIALGKK